MRGPRIANRHYAGVAIGVLVAISNRTVLADDPRIFCKVAAEQAQQLRSAHQLQAARQQLLMCANAACPTVIRTDCSQWLAEVDTAQPSIVIKANDSSGGDIVAVTVLLDGVQLADRLEGIARPINPGVHKFHFEANGMLPIDEQVVIREGEKQRTMLVKFQALKIETSTKESSQVGGAPSASRGSKSAVPYILAGVGVLALGSFAYFGINGRSDASQLAAGCGATKSCSESQVAPVRKKLLLADISLGISAVSLGIATWMFVSPDKAVRKDDAMVQVGANANGGSVQLRWRF